MTKDNYFILTGAMGAGKTSAIKLLGEKGYACIEEPARVILKEQRSNNGTGVPETDPDKFNELMLARMINQYKDNIHTKEIIFFDRGIPDIIGYSELLNTENERSAAASEEFRYNRHVFLFKGWKEIYTTDEERKMNFELSDSFGKNIERIYRQLGYAATEVPFVPAEERVSFILNSVNDFLK